MKKILGIMGSPRKNGNTHVLMSAVLKAAEQSGCTTEIIFLADAKIKECIGCHACWNTRECKKRDDMIQFYPKIEESDILIFGTPVYWYGPTALIKAFLDRFVYFNCPENRKKLEGKKAILIIPFEDDELDTAKPLLEMLRKSFKYLEIPIIAEIVVS